MRVKHAVIAAASGAALALGAPATAHAAPSLTSQIAQELRGDLGDLQDIDVVQVDLDGELINIEVDNLNVEALNDVVVEVLNDLDIDIQDVDVDVDILNDSVVVVDVEILD